MTTLAELKDEVYTITNRSDLSAETTLAIRMATLKAHQSDYYYKDILEEGVIFAQKDNLLSFEVRELVPRWRALKYFRRCDLDSNGNEVPMEFLEILTPEEILDSYSRQKENVCYMAGLELKIRVCPSWDKFLMGCYVHPKVLEDNYDSWVADEYPLTIIYEAAGIIFNMIGLQEQKAIFKAAADAEIVTLKLSNITAIGY